MKEMFSLREGEIFQTLRAMSNCDFVVIGGYAVNAYTLPRFSVDCDIVVKKSDDLRGIGEVLSKRGYRKETPDAEMQYSGSFLRYGKKLAENFAVRIDILIQTVTDRMTNARFEAGWIFENSKISTLKGKTITEEIRLRIITIDALLVMKIISCRTADIRDVFMMLPNARDKEWIKSEIALRCSLKDRISRITEKISSRQFRDGLSGVHGYFDPKVFEKHKKAIITF